MPSLGKDTHRIKTGFKGTSSMVCPWFLHGSSIETPQIDGQTMDEPWRNHGGTMDKPSIKPIVKQYLKNGDTTSKNVLTTIFNAIIRARVLRNRRNHHSKVWMTWKYESIRKRFIPNQQPSNRIIG